MTVDLVFFDLETTGGNPLNSKIIEIAAIKYSNGVEVARFETLINPKRRIPKIVQEITGIDQDMVRSAPALEEVMENFLEFLGDGVIVAHGAVSDYSFVKHNCHEIVKKPFTNYYLCTHLLISNLLPNLPSKTLSSVAEHFGSRIGNTHRAMVDAELTRDVLKGIVKLGTRHGLRSVEDYLKLQGDNETLKRLGPGITEGEIDTVPTSPGVFYFFNSHGEINFLSATTNLRRSISQITELSEERELNRLLVDIADFKYVRQNHFLGALLSEAKELAKFELPLDPRKIEGRSRGLIQLVLPADLLSYIGENPQSSGFDIFGSQGRIRDSLDEFESLYAGQMLLTSAQPPEKTEQTSPELQAFIDDGENRRVNVRRTRMVYPSRVPGKFKLARDIVPEEVLSLGHLKHGVGWVFGPYEQPKNVVKDFKSLIEIFPFHNPQFGMQRRILFLRLLLACLQGDLTPELEALQKRKRSTAYFLSYHLRKTINDCLARIQESREVNVPVGRDCLPQNGLGIVSNTDSKELDLAIVVRSRIRDIVRIPVEDSDKLQSKRFFTRLFCKYNEELENRMHPVYFSEDVCTHIELFQHWKKNRSIEGEWVDFDDLSALYDPSLL